MILGLSHEMSEIRSVLRDHRYEERTKGLVY